MPLTDAQIKSLKPGPRLTRVYDGGGLYVEVAPTGAKMFRLEYRGTDGKKRTFTVGPYPDTKLADARFERERVKRQVREGSDPVEERPRPAREAPKEDRRWRSLAARYIAYRRRDGAAWRTMAKLERQVNETLAILGEKAVDEITAQDILAVVRPIEDRGHVESAHEVRTRCSQIFEFAEAEGIPNSNPARVSRVAMVKRRRGSFAGLTDPREIGGLMRAIRGYSQGEPQVRAALLLSAYLFPRNTELRGMRWDEIDWKRAVWEVPAERMKMKRDHLVPLPRQAVEVLKEIRSWTGRSPLVIPAPRDFTKMVSDMTFNQALRRIGYAASQHVHHGFRTTASTTLNELGFNRDWIERQLAHVEENKVRGTYNKAQYLKGRTEMMQTYADWLDAQAARHQ